MAIQAKGIKTLAATIGLVLSSCASVDDVGPEEGTYWSQDERLFFVSRSGPTALSVVGESGFCLMFNRLRDPVAVDQQEILSGYGCKGFDKASERKWVASYDKDDAHTFTISLISKEIKHGKIALEDLQKYASLKLYRGCNGGCSKWPEPEFSGTRE